MEAPPNLIPRWTDCLVDAAGSEATPPPPSLAHTLCIGAIPGEGVGPELVELALDVVHAVAARAGIRVSVERGGAIGRLAEKGGGSALPESVVDFCRSIYAQGGAILSGAGGGRYVYDLRARFDMFCKISPVVVHPELAGAGCLRPGHAVGTDILVVREGASGLYQGQWKLEDSPCGDRVGSHTFSYTGGQVSRIVGVAARLAARRRGMLTVIYKESGAPTISQLWRECATAAADRLGIRCGFLDIDYSAYRLLQHPGEFDVVVAPNLFGDIVSDIGGVLLGSRGLTYGGNYSIRRESFYQTNHGAAYDLAGKDLANPVAQILAAAMMLRESFGRPDFCSAIEKAVRRVWRDGWRTADLAEPSCRLVGTREFSRRVLDALESDELPGR